MLHLHILVPSYILVSQDTRVDDISCQRESIVACPAVTMVTEDVEMSQVPNIELRGKVSDTDTGGLSFIYCSWAFNSLSLGR